MKKLTVILLTIAVLLVTSCAVDTANDAFDADVGVTNDGSCVLLGREVAVTASPSAELTFDGIPDLVFDFAIDSEQYEYIMNSCDDDELCAYFYDGSSADGRVASVTELGDNGAGEYLVAVRLGGVFKEDYTTEYAVSLALSFTDTDGRSYTVDCDSESASVYGMAYREYTDRRSTSNEIYRYKTAEGDYSSYVDLSPRYAVLSSALFVLTDRGGAIDPYESQYYSSIYSLDYFDGVLTVSLKNGADMTEGLLVRLNVNGEDTYFTVHEGIIKVVIEVAK